MGFKCGIVGLPNVGKSTLFNALTHAGIAAENYPFCTIDPNVGIVEVPDARLRRLVEIVEPQKSIPAHMEFVDIAGLVAGASKGEGLGNQFLAHIRETKAIAHVVRCFEDDNVVHVDGKVAPLDDIEIINTELALADIETLQRALERIGKRTKTGDKEALETQNTMQRVLQQLNDGTPVRAMDLPDPELESLSEINLLTAKPIVYIANVDEGSIEGNVHVATVADLAAKEGAGHVTICAAIEAELSGLTEQEQQEFLADLGQEEPGLNRLIRAGYALLDLQTFFTAGPKEARAWTVAKGATAPQAAGVIHTDFEKGFIRAEVVAYADYTECGGEQKAKESGRWRLEGKDYVIQDGDVVHFRFNV